MFVLKLYGIQKLSIFSYFLYIYIIHVKKTNKISPSGMNFQISLKSKNFFYTTVNPNFPFILNFRSRSPNQKMNIWCSFYE